MGFLEIELQDTLGNTIRYTSGINKKDEYFETEPSGTTLDSHTHLASVDNYVISGDAWRLIDADKGGLESITRNVLTKGLSIDEALNNFDLS